MKRILQIVGLLVGIPIALITLLITASLIAQLHPEPINKVFKAACGVELEPGHQIVDRDFFYSNAIHGVYYADTGAVKVSSSFMEIAKVGLTQNPEFSVSSVNGFFYKHKSGELSWCEVIPASQMIKYHVSFS